MEPAGAESDRSLATLVVRVCRAGTSPKLEQNVYRMDPMTRSTAAADSAGPSADYFWPRSTTLFLLLVGVVLAVFSFVVVLNVPPLPWSPADDVRLREALEVFNETGSLSAWTALTHTTGVGSVLLAVLFGGASAESPYAALGVAQAVAIAIPLFWLPVCVARIFRRARAGYALVLLPPLVWLLNSGTILVGTEFGLSDETSPLRVPALFGLPASLTFLALSMLVLLSTIPMRLSHRVIATVCVGLFSGFLALFDWYAAVAVAIAVSALWWRRAPLRTRGMRAVGGALAALLIGAAVYLCAWGLIQGFGPSTIPSAFPLGGDTGEPLDEYFRRGLFVIKHFGAMISFIAIGFVLALTRRAPQRRALAGASWILLPSLILGFIAAIENDPTLYSFSQLTATLGVLTAVALGAIVWSITSMPSHVRSLERTRLSGRRRNEGSTVSPLMPPSGISVVVPTRNGEDVLEETMTALGGRLSADDEIIVVENGSTDGTTALLTRIQAEWPYPSTMVITHSAPGLGEALRKGVEASIGSRLLLTADDLPFGFTDLVEFEKLPADAAVAIGSKAHPASRVTRSRLRTIQSRIFRFLRAALLQSRVGDSQGTLWVDGLWGREFAHLSRESGLMWTTELVLAAEQQGIVVHEVPVDLSNRHETGTSRFRVSDAWQSFVGFTRLAVYKDDYCNEDWVPSTRPDRDDEEVLIP